VLVYMMTDNLDDVVEELVERRDSGNFEVGKTSGKELLGDFGVGKAPVRWGPFRRILLSWTTSLKFKSIRVYVITQRGYKVFTNICIYIRRHLKWAR
jgi:hypothetical protein